MQVSPVCTSPMHKIHCFYPHTIGAFSFRWVRTPIICKTRASGLVVSLRRRISPKYEAVIRKRRNWNHSNDSLWSLVFISIFWTSASVTAKISWKTVLLPRLLPLKGHCIQVELQETKLVDGFHICVEGSKRSETHNPIPFVASMNCFKLDRAVPWYSSGQGSNDSNGNIWCFGCLPYVCFWKLASDIVIVDSLRLRGGFQLFSKEVTGTALAWSVESEDTSVDGSGWGEGLNATNVWRIADMCTHDTDNLQGDINIDKI